MQGISPVARHGIGVSGGAGDLLTVVGGLTGTLKTVFDGDGAASILQLSTAQVRINVSAGDHKAAPSLSFLDGSTGFYPSDTGRVKYSSAGAAIFEIGAGGISAEAAAGPRIAYNTEAAATTPSIIPDKTDSNTGLGAAAADQLSLIAGGVEGIRIHEATSVWIVQRTPASAPADATLIISSAGFYLDEAGNNLMVKVKYADTTVKSGTVCAVA